MADIDMDVDVAVQVPVNLLPLLDDTDGKTPKTAIVYNSSGIAITWNFVTCAGVMSQTAITPTTGGVYDWLEPTADRGMYGIEIPASGGASANNDTEGVGWITGLVTGVLPFRGPTIRFRAAGLNDKMIESAYDATRGLAGTALPAAAAEAAGGLFTRGSGAGQVNQPGNGLIDVSLKAILNTALTETSAGYLAAAFKKVFDVLNATWTALSVNQTGDGFARLGAPAGASVSADILAVKTDTAAILVDTGTTLDARIPAALTANGNMKCSLMEILATALTETAGLLAGGFKKFFNVAAPTGTLLSLPDAVPGANGGLPTTNGTKVSQTVDLTAGQIPTAAAVSDAVWDEALSGHATGGSAGAALAGASAPSAAAVADAVWDEAISGHAGAGSTGLALAGASAPTAAAVADAVWDEVLHTDHEVANSASVLLQAAGTAADPWLTALPGAYGAGTAGKIIGDNLNAPVGTVDTVVDGLATTLGAAGAGLTSIPNSAGVGTLLTRVPDTISLVAINAEVDTALNTAIPGSPTADSINERVKAIDDKLPASSIGDATAANQAIIAGYLDTEIGAIKADTAAILLDTAEIGTAGAGLTALAPAATALSTATWTGTKAGYLDEAVSAAKTLTAAERNAIADAHLDRANGIETGVTPRQAHRLEVAAAAGVTSGMATDTPLIKNPAGTKTRVTATADADGNRSAITLTDLT